MKENTAAAVLISTTLLALSALPACADGFSCIAKRLARAAKRGHALRVAVLPFKAAQDSRPLWVPMPEFIAAVPTLTDGSSGLRDVVASNESADPCRAVLQPAQGQPRLHNLGSRAAAVLLPALEVLLPGGGRSQLDGRRDQPVRLDGQ